MQNTIRMIPVIPVGMVVPFAGENAPRGWFICDGRALSKTRYASLYEAIGDTYGSSSNEFNLPDLRGRVVVAVGNGDGLSTRTLGQKGGAETHTLSVDEMPSHAHGIVDNGHVHTGTTSENGLHTHSTNANGGQGGLGLVTANGTNTVVETDDSNGELDVWKTPYALTINNSGNHVHTFTSNSSTTNISIQSTGGGQAHNNMPPFIGLNYIIRIV
jgi:microcystin-dependent protein